jgi:glutathione S-transferase
MSYVLYELRGAQNQAFSPFCWRARMALAHKGIQAETRRVRYVDIAKLELSANTVPILIHGDRVLKDSWDIATYLEEAEPKAPSLFPRGDRSFPRFIQHWTGTSVHIPIFKAMAFDIWEILDPEDQPYFRATREKRLGASLESTCLSWSQHVKELSAALAPLRSQLREQNFIGGEAPAYVDYIVFGALQWVRVISAGMLEKNDPVATWFDRCLDLYGGLGRSEPRAG